MRHAPNKQAETTPTASIEKRFMESSLRTASADWAHRTRAVMVDRYLHRWRSSGARLTPRVSPRAASHRTDAISAAIWRSRACARRSADRKKVAPAPRGGLVENDDDGRRARVMAHRSRAGVQLEVSFRSFAGSRRCAVPTSE